MNYFGSFREWCGCAGSAATHLCSFISSTCRLLIMGAASVFRAFWRFLSRQVGNYPSLALGAFLVAVLLTWLLTFASMRARAVGAEAQRDKISYEYYSFKEQHGFE